MIYNFGMMISEFGIMEMNNKFVCEKKNDNCPVRRRS